MKVMFKAIATAKNLRMVIVSSFSITMILAVALIFYRNILLWGLLGFTAGIMFGSIITLRILFTNVTGDIEDDSFQG